MKLSLAKFREKGWIFRKEKRCLSYDLKYEQDLTHWAGRIMGSAFQSYGESVEQLGGIREDVTSARVGEPSVCSVFMHLDFVL